MDALSHFLRPPTRTLRGLLVGIAVAGTLAAALGWQAVALRAAADEAELRADRMSAVLAVKPVEKKSHGLAEEQKKWAALKAEREFSWAEIFASVEKAGSADIELLAFKPDKGNRTVLLGGEARDQAALMVFLDTLAGQANLRNVHLTHQQRKKRERLETVVFEIKAKISVE
jgi:hypothetical protein